MEKSALTESDLVIYPRKIWIVYGWTKADISQEFLRHRNGEIYPMESLDNKEAFAAVYPRIARKSTGKYGILIAFASEKEITISNIAHEAYHAADHISDELGLCVSENTGNEHIAYLVGYIANAINLVKTSKSNKTGKK